VPTDRADADGGLIDEFLFLFTCVPSCWFMYVLEYEKMVERNLMHLPPTAGVFHRIWFY